MDETSIGFVGLGHMGGGMATRFLQAGHPVYGTRRNRESARPLMQAGLQWRDTPREVAEAADVVFTSLPDDSAVQAVATGPDGLLEGLARGGTWIDVSTISPALTRDLAQRVRARRATMLDAPVSGSVPQAHGGTLTIMVGGERDAYARVEPLLRELGTPTHVGDHGQGHVLKLAINISLAVQTLALCEGLLLAEREGIDRELALYVMTSSPIGSPMLKARAAAVRAPSDHASFDIALMHKDIELVLQAAAELEVPLPSAARAAEVLETASRLGYDHHDVTALLEVLEHEAAHPGLAA